MKVLDKILSVLKLMRIYQYLKNVFIFAPIFFAGLIFDFEAMQSAFIAFIAFSLVASGVYILNDYRDIEEDKIHPKKRYRPLASGNISKSEAILIMCSCFLIGFITVYNLSHIAFLIIFTYLLTNIFYSFGLKKIAIIDVTIVSMGFVFRLAVGAVVTDIFLSKWIIIMTFLLALFISLAKRRDDLILLNESGKTMRQSIKSYNIEYINSLMVMIGAIIIVSYLNYTTLIENQLASNSEMIYISTIFVLLGLMRYLQLALVFNKTGSPTKIAYKDNLIKISILMWALFYFWVLYK